MNTTAFMQMSHANCAMKASDMAYEIETLRRKLTESQARFEQLEKQLWYERGISFRNQLNETQRRLEEAQAREAKLREALEAVHAVSLQSHGIDGWHLNGEIATWDSILPEVEQALDIPTDDTALREMIAKAGEVMRERCAKTPGKVLCLCDVEEIIRALPGVTLENLQG